MRGNKLRAAGDSGISIFQMNEETAGFVAGADVRGGHIMKSLRVAAAQLATAFLERDSTVEKV